MSLLRTVSVSMELGIFLFPTYGNMSDKTVLIRSDVIFLRIRSNISFARMISERWRGGGVRMIDVTPHVSYVFSAPPHHSTHRKLFSVLMKLTHWESLPLFLFRYI